MSKKRFTSRNRIGDQSLRYVWYFRGILKLCYKCVDSNSYRILFFINKFMWTAAINWCISKTWRRGPLHTNNENSVSISMFAC